MQGLDQGSDFVTIQLGARRIDVEVPSRKRLDQVITEVLRLVLDNDRVDPGLGGEWVLNDPAGRPLDSDSTLGDQMVADGSILVLRTRADWLADQPRRARRGPPPGGDGLTPRERTRLDLPPRSWMERRLAILIDPRGLRYQEEIDRRIQTADAGRCVVIAIVSALGGAGRSTVTGLVGSLLALLRDERVVAVTDDPGCAAFVCQPAIEGPGLDVADVLETARVSSGLLDTRLCRGAGGMLVLPLPADAVRTAELDSSDHARLLHRLRPMCGVIMLDCGAGLAGPLARAAIQGADQVLLVTALDPAARRAVSPVAGALSRERVALWLAVNDLVTSSPPPGRLAELEAQVPYARGLTCFPAVPRLTSRSRARLALAVREAAAMLAAEWVALPG
jgi:MinD-like ATPase involved in chromosome partitioning or flagellar assembly